MNRTIAVIIFALLLGIGAPTHSAFAKSFTCATFVHGLRSGPGFVSAGQEAPPDYGAVLLAVAETHSELCMPNGVQLAVLQEVFIHWADNNPKLMDIEGWECARRAFAEAWPCPARKQN